jgi:hypothetical protein
MHHLIYTFLLLLWASQTTPIEFSLQQEPEVDLSELVEEDAAVNVISTQETGEFMLDKRGESLLDDMESEYDDLMLHPEEHEDTPIVKRNVPSNLADCGIPWLDVCGQAMPITPTAIADGRAYHHSSAYNKASNEYLIVFDFDWNFDGRPDWLFAARRNAYCYNNEFTTKGNMLRISINGALSVGWPAVVYHPHVNEYLIIFQVRLSSAWVIAGQRISAVPKEMSRTQGPFIVLSGRDSRSRRLHTTDPYIVYVPSTQFYIIAGIIEIASNYKRLHVNCLRPVNPMQLIKTTRVIPFTVLISKPRLVYDPENDIVYVIAIVSRSILSHSLIFIPPTVSIVMNDRHVLVYVILSSTCQEVSNKVTVIGTTDIESPRVEATWDAKKNAVICIWDTKDANGTKALNSAILKGDTVESASGRFKSLDDHPIQHAAITYYSPYEVPVVLWEEQFLNNWYLGGSLLLAGSVAMFSPAAHQSLPVMIHVSGETPNKLIVVWRQHVRHNIRVFAQCICESQTGIPPKAQDIIIGRRGLFYWLPAKEGGVVSAIATNEIPKSNHMDYSPLCNRMAFYNPSDRTIRTANLNGQNESVRVTDVDEPGYILQDFEHNQFFFTNPNEKTVVMVRDHNIDLTKKVVVDLGNPGALAKKGDTLIFPDSDGQIHSTVIGDDGDDGDDLEFPLGDCIGTDSIDSDNTLVTSGSHDIAGSNETDEVNRNTISKSDTLNVQGSRNVQALTLVPGTNDLISHVNGSIVLMSDVLSTNLMNVVAGSSTNDEVLVLSHQMSTENSTDDYTEQAVTTTTTVEYAVPTKEHNTTQRESLSEDKGVNDNFAKDGYRSRQLCSRVKALAKDVTNVTSIAASSNKTCYHDSTRSNIACVSNYTGSNFTNVNKEVVRRRVIGKPNLHFGNGKCTEPHDGKSTETETETNVCSFDFVQKQNGGCEHFSVRKGNDSGCDCRDGYIVVGKSCQPQEPCPTCSPRPFSSIDICQLTKASNTFGEYCTQ